MEEMSFPLDGADCPSCGKEALCIVVEPRGHGMKLRCVACQIVMPLEGAPMAAIDAQAFFPRS